MRLLLDAHALLWWLDNPLRLSQEAKKLIKDGKNICYVSTATIWEIIIKKALGKLDIPDNLEDVLTTNNFKSLSITISHSLAIERLPDLHRDPFDRMLIAQAICEELTLIKRDPDIIKYSVPFILA
jgi:PIN domain nuclease of toxin-antitoxin system